MRRLHGATARGAVADQRGSSEVRHALCHACGSVSAAGARQQVWANRDAIQKALQQPVLSSGRLPVSRPRHNALPESKG
ncbi:hypothetical protein SDC9_156990 [bioreactor metagenome]|uniref:Uncharacterized protein n=1 Tax=bioreactor metagenome TaxID=1076179 RepID=A0A645F5S3_9ZZZZ